MSILDDLKSATAKTVGRPVGLLFSPAVERAILQMVAVPGQPFPGSATNPPDSLNGTPYRVDPRLNGGAVEAYGQRDAWRDAVEDLDAWAADRRAWREAKVLRLVELGIPPTLHAVDWTDDRLRSAVRTAELLTRRNQTFGFPFRADGPFQA